MESWSYGSEGKGFVLSDEVISPTDALARSRKVFTGWDLKPSYNYESTMLAQSRAAVENQGFMELGFPAAIKKPLPDNQIGGFLGGRTNSEREPSPSCVVTPKALFGEEEPCSRLSSSIMESNTRDSSLIDLKLGRLADYRDAQNGESSKEKPILSTVRSAVPAKRARTTSLNSQTPFCQVHGCEMDLSSSKDYHKRHKVCEAHSKTAKVIVNGVEQRFCQQCSRFHLLSEFDDGKRSCRKRLAGHNERRRKPQLGSQSGSRFLGTPLSTKSSFIFPDIFPNGMLRPVKYENSNWSRNIKLEDEAAYSPQSALPITDGNLHQKSLLPPYCMEKPYPSLHSNRIDTTPRSIFQENGSRYPHDFAGSNSAPRSLFRNTSSGSEDFTVFDTASTIQGLSRVSDSGCALSLLSSQSQNSSTHSSGIPMARPLIIQGSRSQYSVGQLPEKFLGVTSQASTIIASTRFSSSEMNSLDVDQIEPVLVSDPSNAVNFEVRTDGIFQGPDFMVAKDSFSHGHSSTVGLLQLSSQLQRVEHQRHSLQVKQENDVFCCLPIN
ncbi:PREDICTED: squamosa promoter-binding-like protein 6 isoform X2 [Nelumbo nucifera]|uniref:Squamosa promoter-binding-like protein 6 isoform X2 n=2 Tax=Nelumbo nucifera TaxID=4432 RepID=A0A1U8Q7B0_NELNU|nr:PREDICTED: squamosa promoter-binding-like protein 6 isoform X2 [Nelumbo nucifera]DAD35096.1 TPA_asm: hypothetical protein HUJ06_005736 [Nelumbo nucifera]